MLIECELLTYLFLVYSSHIKWTPIGEQSSIYKENDVAPVHNDILIAKTRPGHELDLKLVAVKGIGRDHAKFSPVGKFFNSVIYHYNNRVFSF